MTASTAAVGSIAASLSGPLAQVSGVGGSPLVSVAALLAFFAAVVLAVLVTYRVAMGYRESGRRPLLLLAVGLFLLAPAPMFIRLVTGNVALLAPPERSLVVTTSKLLGLLVVLAVVHRS
ncbi:MAG: hypothetical protein ABEJ67_00540 [Halanaeroarchaeum sp.]